MGIRRLEQVGPTVTTSGSIPFNGSELEDRYLALTEEYEQFRMHLPDALLEIELPSLRVTYLNQMAMVLLGYDTGDVINGIRGLDLLEESSRARALAIGEEHMRPSVREGKPYERQKGQTTYDFTMVRKDGSQFDAEVQGSYILDKLSFPIGVRYMFREATGRLKAAEELRRSNQLLQALAEAQAEFIRAGDSPRIFDSLLATLLQLTESSYGFIGEVLEDGHGKPYLKSMALTDISWDEATMAFYRQHAAGGMEFRNLQTLFGRVMVTGTPLFTNEPAKHPAAGGLPKGHPPLEAWMGLPIHAGGRVIGMVGIANRPGGYNEQMVSFVQPFLTTCGTIIEARRNNRLRMEAEERLELALRGGDLSLWDWHAETRNITATSGAATVAGAGEGGLPAIEWLRKAVHPEDRGLVDNAFRSVFRGESPAIECEFRFQMRTGEWGWVLARGTVVEHDAQGKPIRLAGSFQNITRSKNAEIERHRLELQVRQSQKLESLGVFAGGIAHDFNNMLTAVLGNLFMLRETLETPQQREFVAEAAHAAERGAELVRRLLTYARPEVESGELIPLNTLIEETAALARSMLTPQVQLSVRKSRDDGLVEGSRTALEQVLMNLVLNARDAMPRGGTITIARRVTNIGPRNRWAPPALPRGRYHVISVTDTGLGMTQETIERIFDPFFTTKQVGEGTGLGLPTALSIARAHGGWLAVESTPGQGSTFRLLLPYREG